ncbi:MAG TPA: hypothetical protein VFW94_19215 [Candidatus Acidoferrales bacterium]|nr:hypothetical protein [Candidatus Acidoferrales bacterium]
MDTKSDVGTSLPGLFKICFPGTPLRLLTAGKLRAGLSTIAAPRLGSQPAWKTGGRYKGDGRLPG